MASPQDIPAATPLQLKEVRYSLRQLQAEAALERNSGAFGMQKLHQSEISKLFPARKAKRKRHGNSGS